jgi:ABC-type Fe3+/spermidine/putrescine transport system ATPase subunit
MVPSDHNIFPQLTANDAMRLAGQPDSVAELVSFAERRSSELSGGQKQRLALLAEPKQVPIQLRLFDEPFSNLDASAIREAARNILSQPTGAVLVAFPSTTK